jgi:DNA-directed RNA polymerase subunit RPC12/RpoP
MECDKCGKKVTLWKDIKLNPSKEIVCIYCGYVTFLKGITGMHDDDVKLNSDIMKELLTESDMEE